VPSDPAYDVISAATAGSGGLDTSTISSVAGSSSSRRERRAGRAAPDSRGQVAAADAEAVAHADVAGVEHAHDLLGAGAAGGHQPDRAGRTALAKPSPTPPTTASRSRGPSQQTAGRRLRP
jgi:opacity protein-like surface antigen